MLSPPQSPIYLPSPCSVRFLTDKNKVAARLELLASKTYSVRLDGVRILFCDDLYALDNRRNRVLDGDGKPLIMTGQNGIEGIQPHGLLAS